MGSLYVNIHSIYEFIIKGAFSFNAFCAVYKNIISQHVIIQVDHRQEMDSPTMAFSSRMGSDYPKQEEGRKVHIHGVPIPA